MKDRSTDCNCDRLMDLIVIVSLQILLRGSRSRLEICTCIRYLALDSQMSWTNINVPLRLIDSNFRGWSSRDLDVSVAASFLFRRNLSLAGSCLKK